MELAGGAISTILDRVNERIWVKETLKKAHDYHANACVERSLMINELKLAMKDEKDDDKYLVQEEEPVSTHLISVLQQPGQELINCATDHIAPPFGYNFQANAPNSIFLAPQSILHNGPNL